MKLLGIDLGTTSVKVGLYDENLTDIQSFSVDYTLETKDNIVEFEAESYWNIVKSSIDKIKEPIDALAVDTQCETLILTDEDGVPVRKAIVWLDNRATEEAKLISSHFGSENVYRKTGQPEITATWPACKLLWVKRNEPEVWKKTKKVFLLEDYILFKLTGKFVTEKTLQSSTIYFDIVNAVYWKEMLDYIGIDEDCLPELLDSTELVGKYKDISVVAGAMDQIAGAIGAGVFENSSVSVMTGTTMAIFSPVNEIPEYDRNSMIPCHYNYDGKYCMLSWSPTAGMALKWFRNAFCEKYSFEELSQMAAEIEYGCNGLVFLPYLCGSIFPNYNPDARASFLGISPEHTRGHFARSIMEAVACMLKSNLEYMNVSAKEIRTMGGCAKSDTWCQIKADITGKEIVTLQNQETATLGSAILAGVGVKAFDSVEAACSKIKTHKKFTPENNENLEIYNRYMEFDCLLNKNKS